MSAAVEILAVGGLPEVAAGDDLAALIADCAQLRPGDVVVVAQKIVSKAEGAVARPRPGEDGHDARRRLAREHARRIVADTGAVLITETHHGFVCANGGVDGSNAPLGYCVLLPDDPDASARRIREGLRRRVGLDLGVVVTDTFGRPWRRGQTDVAIGVAGLAALRDERGGTDREGRPLEVTVAAVADELAAAADLVRGKADGVPVVLVRGFGWTPDEGASVAADLVRPAGEDLFRRGSGMLANSLASLAEAPAEAGGRLVAEAGGRLVAEADAEAGGRPVEEADVEAARRVASRAGATVAASAGQASTTLTVEGDRLAAGLVVAALADLGCDVTWREAGGRVAVEASREREPDYEDGR